MLPNLMLLYVKDPAASARFYGELLGKTPIEASPGFAMIEARPGMMLGLWLNTEIRPGATTPGGFELALPVPGDDDVDATAKDWTGRGITIVQQPEDMDFGRTFTALDPDGHRLRVYAPAASQ